MGSGVVSDGWFIAALTEAAAEVVELVRGMVPALFLAPIRH
jgi:hypothetical protein